MSVDAAGMLRSSVSILDSIVGRVGGSISAVAAPSDSRC